MSCDLRERERDIAIFSGKRDRQSSFGAKPGCEHSNISGQRNCKVQKVGSEISDDKHRFIYREREMKNNKKMNVLPGGHLQNW